MSWVLDVLGVAVVILTLGIGLLIFEDVMAERKRRKNDDA